MDFMVDFSLDIDIPLQKKLFANAQLVVTGGPWVTHQQCLANQILICFLFFFKPNLDHHSLRKVKIHN